MVIDETTVKSASYKDDVMTVKFKDGNTVEYAGSINVWRKLPLMQRCDTKIEAGLADIYYYILKWGNDYPTAHEKK